MQMTNVVETCKKFMQSSFQMSACKEPSLPGFSNKAFPTKNVHDGGLKKSPTTIKNVLHSFQVWRIFLKFLV